MARRSKLALKARKKNPDFSKSQKRKAAFHTKRLPGVPRRRKRMIAPRLAPVRNPAVDWAETAKIIGIGFSGFAGARLLSRIAATQVEKRKPRWGRHAGAGTAVASFLAAAFFAKRWKVTAPYADELVFGSGLALLQTMVQTYIPQLGWMTADAAPELAAAAATATAPQTTGLLPSDEDEDSDEEFVARGGGSWFSHNDAFDKGRYARAAQPRAQRPAAPVARAAAPAPAAAPASAQNDMDDLLNEIDDDEASGGVFQN